MSGNVTKFIERVLTVFHQDGTVKIIQINEDTYIDGEAVRTAQIGVESVTDPMISAYLETVSASMQVALAAAETARDAAQSALDAVTAERDALQAQIDAAATTVDAKGVPLSITRTQAQLILYRSEMLDAVEAFVASSGREAQILYTAAEWHRNAPTLLAMASALGLTSDQVDALFVAAGQIVT